MHTGSLNKGMTISDARELTVRAEYDVIVAGGGIAGVAAAVAARRCGKRVLLIEKSIVLGGLATLGLILYYNPPHCDRAGNRLLGGIAEELMHRSIRYGYDTLPDAWRPGSDADRSKSKYTTVFSPAAFMVALDELVEEEGVELLLDTLVSAPVMGASSRIEGLIVENKAGRSAYAASTFIDATGDADLMHRAGAACVEDDNWLSFWALNISLESMRTAVETGDLRRGIKIRSLGSKANGRNHPEGVPKFRMRDGEEVTEFILRGRRLLREELKAADRTQETTVTLAGLPHYRTTRRIDGAYVLSEADRGVHFDDSVGCCAEERPPYHILEFPYRICYSPTIPNAWTAGRTVSSVGEARELTRLIGPCALFGQATGIAAALAIDHGCDSAGIPIDRLQQTLADTGVVIHAPRPTAAEPAVKG